MVAITSAQSQLILRSLWSKKRTVSEKTHTPITVAMHY